MHRIALLATLCVILLTAACNLSTPQETVLTRAIPVDTNQLSCFYTPYGIAAPHPVFNEADYGAAQIGLAEINNTYPALAQSEVWLKIVLQDGQIGWVRAMTGSLSGDCNRLTQVFLRPATPEAGCNFYLDSPAFELFDTPDAHQSLGAVPIRVYIPVEARASNDALRLRLDDGRTGWVVVQSSVFSALAALSGSCDTLPVEEIPAGA